MLLGSILAQVGLAYFLLLWRSFFVVLLIICFFVSSAMAEHWHWQSEILERIQGCRREISRKVEGALAGCQPLAGQQHRQCVEEESWKHVIECSQMRQLAATAARFLQCIHRAINFSLTTLWSETFGPVIADKFWGIRFWEGFAHPVMIAYCQKWHLDIADSRRGMFTAPVPFARRICWERELTDQNSKEANQFPCFFTCTRQHQGSSLSWSACCF